MKIENYIYREDECYKGQIGLRRSNIEIPWTDEMFNEYTKCSLDYDYFIKNYYTIVTDSNGCVSDKSNSIYVVVTGINMLYPDDNLIKISPNPAADKIFVEYNADNPDGMLLIYDLEGRMIINQVLDKKNSEINISGLASGVYFLRVKNETGTLVRKFIKE